MPLPEGWKFAPVHPLALEGWKALDSLSKCDTEVGSESLDRRAIAEALSRRCIQVPDHVVDVGIGIPFKAGLTGEVATKTPVGVLNRAALPGTVRIAEVGAQLDLLCNALVPGELAAVVVSDGAARAGGQPAQFRSDGFGCTIGIFAKKEVA